MNFVSASMQSGSQDTTQQLPPERALACLIVETLQLEISAEQIAPDEALFGDGLGLDSIDWLELALAISRTYGVELKSEDAGNLEEFITLRRLSAFLDACRASWPQG